MLIFIAQIVVFLRQIFPLFDFEYLRPEMKQRGEWEIRIILITANVVALGFLTMIQFGNLRVTYIFVSIISLTFAICAIYSN